jgi:hypothetical protein
MKIKHILMLAAATFILSSCAILGMGYDNVGILTGGLVKGQYRVQLVECLGNASSQNVTAVLAVTNTGPNSRLFIGGSLDGSVAIDINGYTAKPYSSAGVQYDLPSGVVVRVEIPRIEPVRPGTPMFQSLTITVGSGQGNSVRFRNVPIVWTN